MTSRTSTHPGGVEGVTAVRPTVACNAERCEVRAHIGVFFDGTGNNRYRDEPRQGDSNIARLFRSYPDRPEEGYFRMYVPGVGTRFPEIGEDAQDGAPQGLGFGEGGEGRILYGLLHILNSMHRASDPAMRFMLVDATIRSLCSQTFWAKPTPSQVSRHHAALKPVGMELEGGLLSAWPSGASHRAKFFSAQGKLLANKIAASNKPRLVEVMIDVFGFSRGAAEARVFCAWLDRLFTGHTLFGVKAQIRFLGIFDTVASVGMPASASGFTDGHLAWADAPHLRIPTRVRNCQHYISAHENRASFPLEMVRSENGRLQGNAREYVYPGMHSDVGGGYSPGEQGRVDGDSEKLSQIPLNDMYAAASAAKVPLDKSLAAARGQDPFAIAPGLQGAYDAWRSAAGGGKSSREWLLPYLAWRYQVRHGYSDLPSTRRAGAKDRDDLIGANATLLADITALENPPVPATRVVEALLGPAARWAIRRDYDKLAPEAPEILRTVKTATVPDALAKLFADYCHDSFAGFRPYDNRIWGFIDPPGSWEPEGYLRWRLHYRGSDRRFTLRHQQGTPEQAQIASLGAECRADTDHAPVAG